MIRWLWIFIALIPVGVYGQSVSIRVLSEDSGEPLYNAHVFNHATRLGNITDEEGKVRLAAEAGDSLSVSYVGYRDTVFIVDGDRSNYTLALVRRMMTEVVVFAAEPFHRKAAEGRQEVPMELLEAIPAFTGDPDIIKSLTFLPGVSGGKDGYSHLSVRGGNIDENLFLLDGAPLYNINHYGGFVSMFHSDLISSVDLYKGYWPSRFGGRLSSVMDVQSRGGNFKEHIFRTDFSPISTKMHVTGPLLKDKVSYIIGGRRTFIDLLFSRFQTRQIRKGQVDGMRPLFTFYDTNAKINARISDTQNLSFSIFRGSDRNTVVEKSGNKHGEDVYRTLNQNFALNYSYYPTLSTSMKLHMSSSSYMHYYEDYRIRRSSTLGENTRDIQERYDHTGNSVKTYKLQAYGMTEFSKRGRIDYGLDHEILRHEIYLDRFRYRTEGGRQVESEDLTATSGVMNTQVTSLFADAYFPILPRFRIKGGVRVPYYRNRGFRKFLSEPKLQTSFDMTKNLTINATYNQQRQYIHSLSYSDAALFREFYTASDEEISPSRSRQWSGGMFYQYEKEGTWLQNANISLEFFYKKQRGLAKFIPDVDPERSVVDYSGHVLTGGEATTYGAEFLFQKTAGRFHGSLAYTYAHSMSRFEGINLGASFPSDFDARHHFNILLLYKFRKGYTFSTQWNYRTGRPFTLVNSQSESDIILGSYPVIPSINSFRLPAYHRLDLSLDREWRTRKKGIKNWFGISLYNAYNRANPYYAYPSDEPGKLKVVGIFPLIPSVHFGFELGGAKKKNDGIYQK